MPPPIGGIAIHVSRVKEHLEQQKNHNIIFDATQYQSRIVRLRKLLCLLMQRPDHIHYHTLYHSVVEWMIVIISATLLRTPVTLIDHDCRDVYKRSRWCKMLWRLTIPWVRQQVIIGTSTVQAYRDNQVPILQSACIESSFIPPNKEHQSAILATYPPSLFAFLEQHRPIIVINAFRLVFVDNKDLYGIDQTLTMLRELRQQFSRIGLVIALAHRGSELYYAALQHHIMDHNLQSHCFFLEDQREMWPLLRRAQLFIRPTLSDSYGISIAEALYFGVPAIASDVCVRPPNTILYQTGNVAELIVQAQKVLTYGQTHEQRHHLHAQQN